MARYFDVHPENPQPRAIAAAVDLLRNGGLIAYPTDSCYALGCSLDNAAGLERIRRIRHLDSSHHFTLVCGDFNQLGPVRPAGQRRVPRGEGGDTRGRTRSSCRPPGRCPDGCCIPDGAPSACACRAIP
jgi:hypothetical protein